MTGGQRLFCLGLFCTSQQDSWLGTTCSGPHSGPAGRVALSYLSGGGQCSWEGVAGVSPRWAWLSETLGDRVGHLLVHGRGWPRGSSPHLGP